MKGRHRARWRDISVTAAGKQSHSIHRYACLARRCCSPYEADCHKVMLARGMLCMG